MEVSVEVVGKVEQEDYWTNDKAARPKNSKVINNKKGWRVGSKNNLSCKNRRTDGLAFLLRTRYYSK